MIRFDAQTILSDRAEKVVSERLRAVDRRLKRKPDVDELPQIHDVRHTWATPALIAGVDVKVVSERLGHSSSTITWSIYQHMVKGMQTDATDKVASLIFGAGW